MSSAPRTPGTAHTTGAAGTAGTPGASGTRSGAGPRFTAQRLYFGGDYNPEQWPEQVWPEDLRLMRDAGVTMVTAGIFSWAKVEPRPGEWDFGWFDRVMDGLADAGIAVCLATMTASPPPWLTHRHPEVLPQTADGRRMHPGSRQHYCPSSPVYRGYAARLTERVALRYAHHPALAMWHVGNEYGCHTRQCYCDTSAEDFREWLHDRYRTVDALNAAWSTAFWSQQYISIDEVLPPRAAPTFPNPAQQLDYLRFSSDALLGCYLTERAVLRKVSPGVPVTTNLMPHHKPVNAFEWARHQDVVSLDFYQDPADPDTRTGAALSFDVMRSAGHGAPWLLLEQAPGAVNWRARNVPKAPGQMRLWSWQAVAQGADAVLFFQWRQSLGGAEKFHSAMLPHGGTETRTYREVAALGAELATVPQLAGTRVAPAGAALVLDWNSWWALELDSHPSTALLQTERVLDHYRPLAAAHVGCDVVPPERELSGYRLVVVPNLYLLEEEDAVRLAAYVRAGGHLLVSFFSGIVDGRDRVHPGGYPGPLREVLGLRVQEFWPLPEGASVAVRGVGGEWTGPPRGTEAGAGSSDGPGAEARGGLWSEEIRLEGAAAVAEFAEGELAGCPAVTRHAYGEGVAWYVGTRLGEAPMRALMDAVRAEAGVGPVLPELLDLPSTVQATVRERRPGQADTESGPPAGSGAGSGAGTGAEPEAWADVERYLFLLNHADATQEIRLPRPMRDLLAPTAAPSALLRLAGRGVAVLEM